ncbi:B3 domain-containing protein At1g49475-like [Solanum stenotomum]|uniref:B3 domain-containing protein At1g49475-like n=1 Tax=Solanum stenotomum TaxID=172797 RepID=UPI0020D12C3E|nr:B3 domain-containing protein At1g49475-like [Solanum stenotomum]
MANKFHGSSFRNSSPNNPKFIQIITSSDELCRLRIPVVFAKRHCKNMLNPVFLEAPHGKAWEVEVENSQGQIWLAKGWKDFCGYYSITVRSLLIFTYNPRSHFDVAIYDQSTTEIEYPIDQEIESDEDIPVLQANANVIDEDIPVLQANANVIEEDIPEDIPVLQANANVIEEEEEDIPVNLQTNANVIIEEEEEDLPINLQTNANVIEQGK